MNTKHATMKSAVCSTFRDALDTSQPIEHAVTVAAETDARTIHRIADRIHRHERGYGSYAKYPGITIRISKRDNPAIECIYTFTNPEA